MKIEGATLWGALVLVFSSYPESDIPGANVQGDTIDH